MNTNLRNHSSTTPRRPVRLGFVPLADCAPLIMAQELGLFHKIGLFQLIRTTGLCKDPSALKFNLGRSVFRTDLFEASARFRNARSTLQIETENESQTVFA